MNPIETRIAQLLQLCGDDPSAALARRLGVFPLYRNESGWVVVRSSGEIVFVDDATGRVVDEVPPEWEEEAFRRISDRFSDVSSVLRRKT